MYGVACQQEHHIIGIQFLESVASSRLNKVDKTVMASAIILFGCSVVANWALQSRKAHISSSAIETRKRKADKIINKEAFLSQFDVFIFDCDGVLWKGDVPIDGAKKTIDSLRSMGKRIFFVTNNSTKSRKGYLKKFESLGFNAYQEEIFSSSFAAAAYFEQNPLPPGKKVYVIGQDGIGEELDHVGVPHIGGPKDAGKTVKIAPGVKIDHDPDVGAVVVGFDSAISYYKIQYAQLCLQDNPDCRFIATNLDAVAHLTDAQEWAGNGAMVGAIKGCTGREPTVVGKPSALMIDYIVDKFGVDRSRICMVGDRLDTDVLFGNDNGLQTVLTLSGVTKESTLNSTTNRIIPDYVVDSIVDMVM